MATSSAAGVGPPAAASDSPSQSSKGSRLEDTIMELSFRVNACEELRSSMGKIGKRLDSLEHWMIGIALEQRLNDLETKVHVTAKMLDERHDSRGTQSSLETSRLEVPSEPLAVVPPGGDRTKQAKGIKDEAKEFQDMLEQCMSETGEPWQEQIKSEAADLRTTIKVEIEKLDSRIKHIEEVTKDSGQNGITASEPEVECDTSPESPPIQQSTEQPTLLSVSALPAKEESTQIMETAGEHQGIEDLNRTQSDLNRTQSGLNRHQSIEVDAEAPELEGVDVHVGFNESIWDASIFIFTGAIGFVGSIQTCLLLMINATAQVVYTLLIAEEFGNPTLDAEKLDDLRKFRVYTAHEFKNMDGITQKSLTTRLCEKDASLEMATYQFNLLTAVDQYLPTRDSAADKSFGTLQGKAMCIVSVLMWLLVIAKELKAIIHQGTALIRLGIESGGVSHTKLVQVDEMWTIKKLSGARLLWAMIIFCLRIFVACFLFDTGLKYLLFTIDLRELVLNSMALECVINLDELVFLALVPCKVSSFVGKLNTIPMPNTKLLRSLDIVTIILFIAAAICICIPIPNMLADNAKQLAEARAILCDGNAHFVYARTRWAPYVVWSNSNDGQDGTLTATYELISSIAFDGALPADLKMATTEGSTWSVAQTSSWRVGDANYKVNPMCQDQWTDFAVSEASQAYIDLVKAGAGQYFAQGINSCNDLQSFCDMDTARGKVTRNICPQVCGCHTPNSSYIITSPQAGCSPKCSSSPEYVQILEQIKCQDMTREESLTSVSWRNHADKFARVAELSEYPRYQADLAKNIRSLMLSFGCDAITKARLEHGEDLCDEDPRRRWPYRSLRLFCPRTCNCTRLLENCPVACGWFR